MVFAVLAVGVLVSGLVVFVVCVVPFAGSDVDLCWSEEGAFPCLGILSCSFLCMGRVRMLLLL